MKDIELMAVSPPCTTVPDMEKSLSPVGRKSEQDPTASSMGGQPPHCSVSRTYVDAPAVPKLTFVPPAACSHTSSWLGSPHAYATVGEEEMWNIQRRKLLSVHTREYGSPLRKPEWPFYRTAHPNYTLLKGNLGSAFLLCWLLEKKAKTVNFSHCLLFEEIG